MASSQLRKSYSAASFRLTTAFKFRHSKHSDRSQSTDSVYSKEYISQHLGPITQGQPVTTTIPLTLVYMARLMNSGKISQEDYDMVKTLLDRDVAKSASSSLTISLPGYISFSKTTSTSELQAIARVLNTSELLESILSHLPLDDLHQRIPLTCKAFRDAANTSPHVRRRLWQVPIPHSPTITIKPFSPKIYGTKISSSYSLKHEIRGNFQGSDYIVLNLDPQAVRRATKVSPSLSSTFLTQPPVNHFVAVHPDTDVPLLMANYFLRQAVCHDDGGITFGHVSDFLHSAEEDGYALTDFGPHLRLVCLIGPKHWLCRSQFEARESEESQVSKKWEPWDSWTGVPTVSSLIDGIMV